MKTLYCSFCGKSQHEVKRLIAGSSVFICDECAALAHAICQEKADGEIEYQSWIDRLNATAKEAERA